MNRAALRAHIINASFGQLREPIRWFRAVVTTLTIATISGALALMLSLLSQ
jgi:hypothetical protein